MNSAPATLDGVVAALKAAGEETRLRILALLAAGELSVSDLTDILGQSQPRVSRHLKLLVEAGLVERHREGSWAFFRLVDPERTRLVHDILSTIAASDAATTADRTRRAAVRAARAEAAQSYFAQHAGTWDKLRSLHVPEAAVEAAIDDMVAPRPINALVDLGTGTGRMLTLLARRARRAVGVDASHAMLAVARAQLEKAGLTRVELRQGDILAPPVERDAFDLVVIHQVLHYLDDPAWALKEAARLLAPGGRLLIVDFAPHDLEFLREAHAHRRLGFSQNQMSSWLTEAGLDLATARDLVPAPGEAAKLTVSLWLGQDRRIRSDLYLTEPGREVA